MGDKGSFDYAERSDIESVDIAWLAAGLALFVVATPLVMPLAFPPSMRHRTPVAPPALSSEAPALEVTPRHDLQNFNRSEIFGVCEQLAAGTDRSHGVVRILDHAGDGVRRSKGTTWMAGA